MDSCLSLKIWAKILVKIQLKTVGTNTVKNFLITLNNLPQIHFKLLQKKQFKKQQKQLVI